MQLTTLEVVEMPPNRGGGGDTLLLDVFQQLTLVQQQNAVMQTQLQTLLDDRTRATESRERIMERIGAIDRKLIVQEAFGTRLDSVEETVAELDRNYQRMIGSAYTAKLGGRILYIVIGALGYAFVWMVHDFVPYLLGHRP